MSVWTFKLGRIGGTIDLKNKNYNQSRLKTCCDQSWIKLNETIMLTVIYVHEIWLWPRVKNGSSVSWRPPSCESDILSLQVPTTYHCGSQQQSSLWSIRTDEGPSSLFVWVGGRCTPWILLIHPHPIVKTLPCDWSNTMRTCIPLTLMGKLTWVYIGGTSRWNQNSRTLLLNRSRRGKLCIYDEGSANNVSLDMILSFNLCVIVGDLRCLAFVEFSGLRPGYHRSCDYKPTH